MAAHIKRINSLPSLFFLKHKNVNVYILSTCRHTFSTIILHSYSINYHSQSQIFISEYKLRFIQKERKKEEERIEITQHKQNNVVIFIYIITEYGSVIYLAVCITYDNRFKKKLPTYSMSGGFVVNIYIHINMEV